MKVNHSATKIDTNPQRGSYTMTITYLPGDVKHYLQALLRDLRKYRQPNKFTQVQLEGLMAVELFGHFAEDDARDLSMWAFRVAFRKGYVTSNVWDKEQPTIWFINSDILNMVPGPQGPRKASMVKHLENKLRIREEIEKDTEDES